MTIRIGFERLQILDAGEQPCYMLLPGAPTLSANRNPAKASTGPRTGLVLNRGARAGRVKVDQALPAISRQDRLCSLTRPAHAFGKGLKRAMLWRLRVRKEIFTPRRWSVQPCVQPVVRFT